MSARQRPCYGLAHIRRVRFQLPLGGNHQLLAWSHVASTYDGTNLRFYLNGVVVTTEATTGAMHNTANPVRIGGNAVWGEYFAGLIDEVRVYNRALTGNVCPHHSKSKLGNALIADHRGA